MRRFTRYALLIALLIASSARAQGNHPPTLTVDGGAPIPLVAQARRADLLGAVDLYSVAVYVEGSRLDRAHLLSTEVAKALRVEITFEDDLRRRIMLDWRPELIPKLNPDAMAHLRGSFAPLKSGDVVLIEYVPTRGTTVRVNKGVAVAKANHDLMLAFLDHWLGQRAVSEEIKRTLLGSS